MQAELRHKEILEALRRTGRVEVPDLAERLDTSAITVRRDLDHLASVGALRRVRGGAVTTALRGEGLPFDVRAADDAAGKARLARAAAQLVADGEAVIIDSGTTGAAAAAALASRRLHAMPLSVQAIAALAGSPGVDLVLPGGSVRKPEGTLVGSVTERSIAALRFDTAIMTCCAASPENGVMAYDLGDAAVKQALRRASARTVLLAEGTKFARSALAVVCLLEEVDVLVTDATAPPAVLERLTAAGVQVVVC